MLRNYFTSAFRNIRRNKFHSLVNIFGLSIGIAFCTLIALYIRDERSFDQFHTNKENIYRVETRNFRYDEFKKGNKDPFEYSAMTRVGVGQAMQEELPDVAHITRILGPAPAVLKNEDRVFTENVKGVDSAFFTMFNFKILAGNPKNIFRSKHEIVLTSTIAEKYFENGNALGKIMTLDISGESTTVTVSGVIEPPPGNSSISYDVLMSLHDWPGLKSDWANGHNCTTFVELLPDVKTSVFEANLNELLKKFTGEEWQAFREREKIPDEYVNELHISPISEIHLNTKIPSEKSSDPQYSLILGGVALLIMIVACINYVSIALTKSANRATEVGVRKVSGALKNQLAFQFGLEAILLCFFSMAIGVVMVILFLPTFNSFTSKSISLSLPGWLFLTTVSIGITLAVGMIAGSYPALFLSSMKPALILKGRFNTKAKAWFTKPLVVAQFAFSAFLIMTSLVMHRQMNFLTTKDLGYDQHQVLIIPTHQPQETTDRFVEQYRSALSSITSVESVAGAGVALTQGTFMIGFPVKGEFKTANGYIVDAEYINTLGIHILEGRNFDVRNTADNNAVIVNQALVNQLKWSDPLKEHLDWRAHMGVAASNIIGVVNDHNFVSLESDIGPMFMTMDKTFGHLQFMLVKISPIEIPKTLGTLEKIYKNLASDKPFEYTFLEESVALQYASYQRWMNIMTLSTVFAVLISSLGLFGLAGVNAANRTREIGIRKSLGAEVGDIFLALNKEFLWLSIISFALATAPAWYTMRSWLNNFHFKVEGSWLLFLIGMGISMFVAVATLTFHSLKAIKVNPVDCLRHE